VCGVRGLDQLLCRSEIAADDDVDVLLLLRLLLGALGFLRFLHGFLLSFPINRSLISRVPAVEIRVKLFLVKS